VRECGQDVVDLRQVNYAVTDLPDDDLSEILAKRPLEHAEAMRVFTAVASALDYLHERSLHHGAVVPSSVFYVNGQVKLTVDTLAPAGDTDKQADLRQFGATVSQSLSRLERPFNEIVPACMKPEESKWTASVIVERLAAPAPFQIAQLRKFAVPAAALVVAIIMFVILRKHPEHPVQAVHPVVIQAASPAKPSPAGPEIAVAHRSKRSDSGGRSWAVIAAAYRDYKSAEKRASAIRKQWPQWKTHVSPPAGRGQRYFVVIGSGLTRDVADKLKQAAVSKGAPPDTYVTKLDES
jgi:hypothetical protein